MKPVLAFMFHFVIAILAVPMLTLFSAPMANLVMRHLAFSATSPQQFFSDHLLFFAGATGLWLSYLVCDTFTSRSAVWVWIPALLAFGLRVAIWRSTGSALFHDSVVEHFFTVDCQIEAWHDAEFPSRCADKLFLMQLVVGTFAYSAGAVIQRIVEMRRHRSDAVSS